jgi:DNA-binding response OmpR family regulator
MDAITPTILIVEDDPDIRRLVSKLLRKEEFCVEEAEDAVATDAVLARTQPDLIILDLMLPGEGGLSICRRIRAQNITPILMLTAKSDEIDRVIGLEMGADDYLVKPFGPRELLARVRALLRRANVKPPASPTRRFAFDRFVIDLDARQLCRQYRWRTHAHDRGIRSSRLLRAKAAPCADTRPDTRLDSWTRSRSVRSHRRYAGLARSQEIREQKPWFQPYRYRAQWRLSVHCRRESG